ncbi:glycosyltransferase family protein [Adhaeretor mobilis]|uniref:GNT-I family protein n=1 Tax=Adhaeretor mobilis TaxID=1930276 RepID=A0A517N0M6_9BACT|nr:glycosyltransferase family 2 protein [Adhaeretor mobilis]QDT00689.1 GNT-I family protein [Adhaeretor mobilis]
MSFSTPIVMLVFNRPDLTSRVLNEIARQRPRTLLVCCDGPRQDVASDAANVAATRALFDKIDWPCELLTQFNDENLGCQYGVAGGLNWAFQHVERAVILEDDCLPHSTFFNYCQSLLDQYEDDQRIMAISGDNFQEAQQRTPYSYYFSKYMHCWGWATWRRAWEKMDLNLDAWPAFRDSGGVETIADSPAEAWYWRQIFERQQRAEIDSWAFSYQFTCWLEHGLTILPEKNLISNIGFGERSTHTANPDHHHANLPTFPIGELRHPPRVHRHREADKFTFPRYYFRDKLTRKLRRAARRLWANYFDRPVSPGLASAVPQPDNSTQPRRAA